MTIDDELTCKDLVELVTEYLDGSMDGRDRARFEAHLAECPGCTTYIEQMRFTIRVLGTLSQDAFEPEARDRLLQAFRTWKHS
jgi:anti-sigma factor RsiW